MPRYRLPAVPFGFGGRWITLNAEHGHGKVRRRRPVRSAPVVAIESLESRSLFAVTAFLFGNELQIALGSKDDVASISSDGIKYVVRGTGLTGYAAANADVKAISVAGTQADNQSFMVAAGVGAVLTDPLSVFGSIERTTIIGTIDTVGQVSINSPAITLAADVTTTGSQTYKGVVSLVGSRTLSTGTGAVGFGSTVNSSPEVFIDPDAFAAGTDLTNVFPGITLSAVGTGDTGVLVTAEVSPLPYATGPYAPTGNRVFAGRREGWNAPNSVFKAAFASPVSRVSLDFDDLDPNAYLQAFDSTGTLVATVSPPPVNKDPADPVSFVTLSVSAPSIAYVLASFGPTGDYAGLLDNLRATYVTTPAASLAFGAAPTNVLGTPGNSQVSLTWTAPVGNGGAAITDYVVQYKTTSAATWTTFNDGTSTNTSATVTGLQNGTAYVFRVLAKTPAGTGTASTTTAAITPRTVPSAPTNVLSTPGNSQVSLTWAAPASNGGTVITDYIVQYKTTSATTWTTYNDGKSTKTSATVTKLQNGTAYVFRVLAVNAAGTGTASTTTAAITPRTVPSATRRRI